MVGQKLPLHTQTKRHTELPAVVPWAFPGILDVYMFFPDIFSLPLVVVLCAINLSIGQVLLSRSAFILDLRSHPRFTFQFRNA